MNIKAFSIITKLEVGERINWTKSRAGPVFQIRKISWRHAISNILPSNIWLTLVRKERIYEIIWSDILDHII